MAGEVSHSDEGTNEQDVEHKTDKGEEADSAEAAGQNNRKDGVESGSAGETLNSPLPICDWQVTFGENSEEVGIDTQDDGGAAEAEEVKKCLREAQEASLDDTHGEVMCVSAR